MNRIPNDPTINDEVKTEDGYVFVFNGSVFTDGDLTFTPAEMEDADFAYVYILAPDQYACRITWQGENMGEVPVCNDTTHGWELQDGCYALADIVGNEQHGDLMKLMLDQMDGGARSGEVEGMTWELSDSAGHFVVKTVRDLLINTFGDDEVAAGGFADMPIESHCGIECQKVVDAWKATRHLFPDFDYEFRMMTQRQCSVICYG